MAARAKAFRRIEAGLRESGGVEEEVAIKNRSGFLVIREGRVDGEEGIGKGSDVGVGIIGKGSNEGVGRIDKGSE